MDWTIERVDGLCLEREGLGDPDVRPFSTGIRGHNPQRPRNVDRSRPLRANSGRSPTRGERVNSTPSGQRQPD